MNWKLKQNFIKKKWGKNKGGLFASRLSERLKAY
jgi:hypothetical protein